MAITIQFSDYALCTSETLIQRIQFVYSPLHELFRSLHILLNPRHHGTNIDWIIDVQSKLTDEFQGELRYFQLFYELGISPILLCNFNCYALSLDGEIEALKQFLAMYPRERMVDYVTSVVHERENSFIPILAKGLEWKDYTIHTSYQLVKDLQSDPAAVYDRLFNFIEWYRHKIFDATWHQKSIQTLLLQEIQKQSTILKDKGPIELFNSLQSDRMHWNDNELVIIKPFEQCVRLRDTDAIMLIPSYFIWPHLFVETFDQGIAIAYDITKSPIQYPSIPDDLAFICKALSEPIRVQIMTYIMEKPSTTQSLAQILNMSESSISRHLQILKEAKLLTATKHKKFVLYEPTQLLPKLIPDFYNILLKTNTTL